MFSCAGSCPRFIGGVNWRCLNNCGASHSNHVCQITISLRSEIRIRHNFWDSLIRPAFFYMSFTFRSWCARRGRLISGYRHREESKFRFIETRTTWLSPRWLHGDCHAMALPRLRPRLCSVLARNYVVFAFSYT